MDLPAELNAKEEDDKDDDENLAEDTEVGEHEEDNCDGEEGNADAGKGDSGVETHWVEGEGKRA